MKRNAKNPVTETIEYSKAYSARLVKVCWNAFTADGALYNRPRGLLSVVGEAYGNGKINKQRRRIEKLPSFLLAAGVVVGKGVVVVVIS